MLIFDSDVRISVNRYLLFFIQCRLVNKKCSNLNRRVPQSSTQSAAEKLDIKRLYGTLRLLSVLCVKKFL